MSTLTVYPDAHIETNTVDGRCSDTGNNLTWANLIIEAGSAADDSTDEVAFAGFVASATENQWASLYRGIYLFDTSALTLKATILSAIFSVYGTSKQDGNSATPTLNIYSSNPASNTSLASGDFDSLGSTPFCDTPITYAGFNTAGYNSWTLNAAGLAAISKTGITKLGIRNANYDVAAESPAWVSTGISWFGGYMAEKGEGYKPKLVIEYTTVKSPFPCYFKP